MEHKLILGGEQYLPFARSRIKAMRATGLKYASQAFEIDGCSIKVRIEGEHSYIRLEGGGPKLWALLTVLVEDTTSSEIYTIEKHTKLIKFAPKTEDVKRAKLIHSGATTHTTDWVTDSYVEVQQHDFAWPALGDSPAGSRTAYRRYPREVSGNCTVSTTPSGARAIDRVAIYRGVPVMAAVMSRASPASDIYPNYGSTSTWGTDGPPAPWLPSLSVDWGGWTPPERYARSQVITGTFEGTPYVFGRSTDRTLVVWWGATGQHEVSYDLYRGDGAVPTDDTAHTIGTPLRVLNRFRFPQVLSKQGASFAVHTPDTVVTNYLIKNPAGDTTEVVVDDNYIPSVITTTQRAAPDDVKKYTARELARAYSFDTNFFCAPLQGAVGLDAELSGDTYLRERTGKELRPGDKTPMFSFSKDQFIAKAETDAGDNIRIEIFNRTGASGYTPTKRVIDMMQHPAVASDALFAQALDRQIIGGVDDGTFIAEAISVGSGRYIRGFIKLILDNSAGITTD